VTARVVRLAEVCEAHGVDVPTAAIAFTRRHPAVASVVVGVRSPREVDEHADRFDTTVPETLWADLASSGLIDAACAS
jgi:D-threo-aldose 1-dehydrogenase